LAPLLQRRLRFTPPRNSLFAHLCRVITGQQVSTAAADTIFGRLRAAVGRLTPERMLALDEDALRAAGLSRQKARYLRELAGGIVDGTHRLGALGRLSDAQVHQRLTAIRGLGTWSADMVLIFRLHRPDVLPTLDIGVRRAMERLYRLDPAMPQRAWHDAAERIAAPWRPWRSLAVRHLWAWGDADVNY